LNQPVFEPLRGSAHVLRRVCTRRRKRNCPGDPAAAPFPPQVLGSGHLFSA